MRKQKQERKKKREKEAMFESETMPIQDSKDSNGKNKIETLQ